MVAISLCDPAASPREASFDPIFVPDEAVRAGGGDARPMPQSDVDRVQRSAIARTNGGRIATDAGGVATLAAPVTKAARTMVCPDLTAAGDANRPWWKRLAHAVFLGAGIAGGPDAVALKALGLRAVESTATHAVYTAAEGDACGGTPDRPARCGQDDRSGTQRRKLPDAGRARSRPHFRGDEGRPALRGFPGRRKADGAQDAFEHFLAEFHGRGDRQNPRRREASPQRLDRRTRTTGDDGECRKRNYVGGEAYRT